jgi:secondary thiamine-phosphate synthase enzyme
MVKQIEIELTGYKRGFHLITRLLIEKLPKLPNTGIIHFHIKHTSAALTLNENADPTVRQDFEQVFNKMVPENQPYYNHTLEGSDDMPAHIKSSLLGNSVTIPITNGKMNLGTWQGIYLCEFRNQGGSRELVVTIWGE